METDTDFQPIKDFYRSKNVFITGVTGFIGKVLLEKLLRAFPDIGTLYLLIRSKKGQSLEVRLKDVTNSAIFDNVRTSQPGFESKLHIIDGDLTMPRLGLSSEDRHLLEKNVNVIFHSAASVRFNEPLKTAVEFNVLPIQKLITLCQGFQNLQAFVHISTVYANCDRSVIEEKIYPFPIDYKKLLNSLEWMDDSMVSSVTPHLLADKPNTYTYTKQLAEHILLQEGTGLPIAIVRPSIVGAAWKEPIPGWLDNYSGASGLYIAAGKGMLRSMRGEIKAVADIVPVDIPSNICIIVGWYTAMMKPSSILVFHSTTGAKNPYTWGEMEGVVQNFYKKIPLDYAFRRPKMSLTNNSFIHDYWLFVSHMIPAYVADVACMILGKKPRMVKAYSKLHRSMGVMNYFTCNTWDIVHRNLDLISKHMTPEECKEFYFDPRPLNWPDYIENFCLGTKQYVLNEDMSRVPAAKAHLKKLRNARYAFNTVIAVILWRLLVARSHLAKNVWYFIMSLAFKIVRFFRVSSSLR